MKSVGLSGCSVTGGLTPCKSAFTSPRGGNDPGATTVNDKYNGFKTIVFDTTDLNPMYYRTPAWIVGSGLARAART
jgi:hypothetical protein